MQILEKTVVIATKAAALAAADNASDDDLDKHSNEESFSDEKR